MLWLQVEGDAAKLQAKLQSVSAVVGLHLSPSKEAPGEVPADSAEGHTPGLQDTAAAKLAVAAQNPAHAATATASPRALDAAAAAAPDRATCAGETVPVSEGPDLDSSQ